MITPIRTPCSVLVAMAIAGLMVGCERPAAPDAEPVPDVPAPQVGVNAETTGRSQVADVAAQVELVLVPSADSGPLAQVEGAPPLDAMAAPLQPLPQAPVELHYLFDGVVTPGQSVALHLAVVPQVAGRNLEVSIEHAKGLRASARTLRAQDAEATLAYRQQVSVTRQPDGPDNLRVLVTMDSPEGPASSYFNLPLTASAAAGPVTATQW